MLQVILFLLLVIFGCYHKFNFSVSSGLVGPPATARWSAQQITLLEKDDVVGGDYDEHTNM
jgi:hypothetical protein